MGAVLLLGGSCGNTRARWGGCLEFCGVGVDGSGIIVAPQGGPGEAARAVAAAGRAQIPSLFMLHMEVSASLMERKP